MRTRTTIAASLFKVLLSLCLLPVTVTAQAVFIGGGFPDEPYLWDGADNWLNGQVPVNGSYVHILASTSEVSRESENTYKEIRFLAGSGAVAITGAGFTLVEADNHPIYGWPGRIINESGVLQSISVDSITIFGPAHQSTWQSVFDTGVGGLVISSDIFQNDVGVRLRGISKDGTGVLTLMGHNYYEGETFVREGTLVQYGGDLTQSSVLRLGNTYSATGVGIYTAGAFEVRGGANVEFDNLQTSNTSALNRITVEEDNTLTLTNVNARVLVELEGIGGNKGKVVVNGSLSSGFDRYVLVKDDDIIGFGYIDENNQLVRRTLDMLVTMPVAGANNANEHYKVSGQITGTAGQYVSARTLTIIGGGSIDVQTGGGGAFSNTNTILMSSGFNQDFTIYRMLRPNDHQMNIYQYNTEADLVLAGRIMIDSGLNLSAVVYRQYGEGRVRYTAADSAAHSNETVVGGGTLQLEGGGFGGTSMVRIMDGAVLRGNAKVGGNLIYNTNVPATDIPANYRYTVLHVYKGGTLDATPLLYDEDKARSLQVTGVIHLYEGSNFKVDLNRVDGVSYSGLSVMGNANGPAIVNLNGNLALTLNYIPVAGEWIVLLELDGSLGSAINGKFATANGLAITEDQGEYFFMLTSTVNQKDYLFQIDYAFNDGQAVAIMSTVPEPTTAAVCAGMLLLGVIAWRRRAAP